MPIINSKKVNQVYKIKFDCLALLFKLDKYQKICLVGFLFFLFIILPLIFFSNLKINKYFYEKEYLNKLIYKESKLKEKVPDNPPQEVLRDLNIDIENIKKIAELANLNVIKVDLQNNNDQFFFFFLQGNYLDFLNFLNSYNSADHIYQYEVIAVKKEAGRVAIEMTFSFNGVRV